MRFSHIITALIVVIVIALAILQRDFLKTIFTSSPDPVVVMEAKEKFAEATEAVKTGEASIENTRKALEALEKEQVTKEKALELAKSELDELDVDAEERARALEEAQAQRNPLVEVMVSNAQPVDSGVVLSGKVEAGSRLDVRAETSGTVSSPKIPAGKQFLEGELICQIDAGAREANLRTAETQRDATKRLFDEGLASAIALQNAQASYQTAKDEYDRSFIRAPFDATSLTDTPETGSVLSAGGLCVTLGNLDELVVVGYAAESQIDDINTGAKAAVEFSNGKTSLGVVTNVGDTADPITKAFRVEITMPNSADVRDGATAKMSIALDKLEGHLLPHNAIVLSPEGIFGVIANEDSVARFLPVQYLYDVDEGAWVADLPETVEIVVTGQDYLVDGQDIRVDYRSEEDQAEVANEGQE